MGYYCNAENYLDFFATLPVRQQFSCRLIKKDTWIINPVHLSPDTPRPHLLIGKEKALVIDACDTRFPLKTYIQKYITDKPLMVASTHAHFDHTLANGQFADCPIFMSPAAIEEVRQKTEEARTTTDPHLIERYRGHILGNYTPIPIVPGDMIDLGDRIVECIELYGCHSITSTGYVDHGQGILFSGDELDGAQDLIQGGGRGGLNCVERFRDNMVHLREKRDRGEFDTICPPHNGSPMDAGILDNLIDNCEYILSGHPGTPDIGSFTYLLNPFESRPDEKVKKMRFDPSFLRSDFAGTSIVYSADRITYADLEKLSPDQR